MPSIILRNLWYSSSDGFSWSVPSCSSFMTLLLHVLAFSYRAGPSLRGRRPSMAQAAACGPDSNPSPPAGRRAGPSPRGLAFPRAPYGTAANDASMMMQPLP